MQSHDKLNIVENNVDDFVHGVCDWGSYRLGYFLARAKGKEKANEDSVFLISNEKKAFFGVSDGAGGHPKGDEASSITVNVMKDLVSEKSNALSPLDLIFSANNKVLDLKVGARCTLTFCELDNNYIQAFSVGDSEVIGWNHLGTEIYSNIPDSATGHSIEAGYMTQEESLNDPERYIVNNMIGDKTLRVEVSSKIETKKGHTYLVGSDGLFDNFSHKALYAMIGEGSFEESLKDLVLKCQEQKSELFQKNDDISFVLVRKVKA